MISKRTLTTIISLQKRALLYQASISKPYVEKYKKGDYYGVLGVQGPGADDEALKMRYYGLLKKYHTDVSHTMNAEIR